MIDGSYLLNLLCNIYIFFNFAVSKVYCQVLKLRSYVAVFVFVCLHIIQANAQSMSTMGNDFWLSFMLGRDEAAMSVTITGIRACTGTITNPNTGWSHNFSVPAGGSVTVGIDTANSYNTVSNVIANKGLHVTATDTVSVYASNFLRTSFDVTYILPTEALGNEYMVQTFETWRSLSPSEILVVATEDNTIVDIVPTAPTIGRNTTGGFSITLDAGQSYLMQCNGTGDYSGTRVKSRECKPIAVFNGHLCAHIPVVSGAYCDHLFEQSIPVEYWGRRFVATKSQHHNGDYLKITSLKDNCNVSVGGSYVTTINAGESYEFTLTGSNTSKYIETSQPATFYSYLVSKNSSNPDGDPSMTLVAPIEQQLKDVVFVNYNNVDQLTQYHYLNVVAHTADISQIYLDGVSLWNSFSPVSGNSAYSFARVQTTPGTHRLRSLGQNGFIANVYGVGANESYGYSVGFSTRPNLYWLNVSGAIVAQGDTLYGCVGDTLKAYIVTEDSINIYGWYREGTYITEDDTLLYVANNVGIERFRVNYGIESECYSMNDSMWFYVVTGVADSSSFDTVLCDGSFFWNGIRYDSSGVYTQTIESTNRCDSIVELTLQIRHSTTTYVDSNGCDSVFVNGRWYYSDTTFVLDTYTNQDGCDSIVKTNIVIHPSYFNDVFESLHYGDTLIWLDYHQYADTNIHPVYRYKTVWGCDSALRLNINLIYPPPPPPMDSSAIWVPNAFTPDESNNTVFRIFCNDILEAQVYIFNRWGDYVTDFDGLTGCWDGRKDGKPCKTESYVYIINYRIKTMPKILKKKTGMVTLIR